MADVLISASGDEVATLVDETEAMSGARVWPAAAVSPDNHGGRHAASENVLLRKHDIRRGVWMSDGIPCPRQGCNKMMVRGLLVDSNEYRLGRDPTEYLSCPNGHIVMHVGRPANLSPITQLGAFDLGAAFAQHAQATAGVNYTIHIENQTIQNLHPAAQGSLLQVAGSTVSLGVTGNTEIAEAISRVAEVVTKATELDETQRTEYLEVVGELSRQAQRPDKDRSGAGVLRSMIGTLEFALNNAANSAQIWSTWGGPIKKFFGL